MALREFCGELLRVSRGRQLTMLEFRVGGEKAAQRFTLYDDHPSSADVKSLVGKGEMTIFAAGRVARDFYGASEPAAPFRDLLAKHDALRYCKVADRRRATEDLAAKCSGDVAALVADPFLALTADPRPYSFHMAVDLAAAFGLSQSDLCARFYRYRLAERAEEGHTCVRADEYAASIAAGRQGYSSGPNRKVQGFPEAEVAAAAAAAVAAGHVVLDAARGLLYEPKMFHMEQAVRRFLAASAEECEGDEVAEAGGDFSDEMLTAEQRRAVAAVLRPGVGVVTGPAGSGKTRVVREVLAQARRAGRHVHLAAPTGKARRRLQEACGREVEAHTLHRLLGINCRAVELRDGALLVVDEASMVDIHLAAAVAAAARKHRLSVAFFGDSNQLESVGPGNVLHDVIEALPPNRVTRLERCFRQDEEAEGAHVLRLAHRVLAGQYPEPGELDNAEVTLVPAERGSHSDVVRKATFAITSLDGVRRPFRVQALGGTNALVDAINLALVGSDQLLVGQKALCTENATAATAGTTGGEGDERAMNGDIGLVVRTVGGKTVIEDEAGCESTGAARSFKHGYAITIHKSQGTEIDAVVLALTGDAFDRLLNKKLIYTAATRARRRLVIVADPDVLRRAIATEAPRRLTGGFKWGGVPPPHNPPL